MWEVRWTVTDNREWDKPLLEGSSEGDDPASLMLYVLHRTVKDRLIEQVTRLKLSSDGLLVAMLLRRADSQKSSSSEPPPQVSHYQQTTSAGPAGPSFGV